MARPKSDDKRSAILAAAARVIVAQGLGAPTAVIAREAGVANGSLFTYFETKTDLFNQLYLEIKSGMAAAALQGVPAEAGIREQMYHLCSNWMGWAVANPELRSALAQLSVSDELTQATRTAGHKTMAGLAELLEKARMNGPMREAPMGYVLALMNSLTEATMDYMLHDPANAKKHSDVGFEAMWRMLS